MDDYQIEKMLEAARRERKDRSLCEKYDPSAEQVEQLKRFHCNVNIEQLTPFRDHPFRLYDETRLNDMAESIKANGIISSIIVRPSGESGQYEILSGHNRVNAAKMAGLKVVPVDILENLTDDEAALIVAESNLIQRSFADMPHSERAAAIFILYNAMKKKSGYRSDLAEAIEEMTRSPLANRPRTMAKLGEHYGLSKDTIARYLRVHQLTASWRDRLDHETVSFRAAVELSYLNVEEQEMVARLLQGGKKPSIKQAKMLREASATGELTEEKAKQILMIAPHRAKTVALRQDLFARYFREDQTAEEIEDILAKALELYFRQNHNTEAHE